MTIRLPLRSPAPRPAGLLPLAAALLAGCAAGAAARPAAGPAPGPAIAFVEGPPPDQNDAPQGPCLANLPDSLLTVLDTVYLHAFLVDTGARTLLVQADLLAQRTAYRLRRLLGGRLDSLPSGEPVVTWRSRIGGNLAVRARRDGNATWHELLPMPFPDTVPTRLLARALDSVVANREMVAWPHEAPRESLEMRLALARSAAPSYTRAIGAGFPVFTLRFPAEAHPELLAHPPVHYPPELRDADIEGHVVLRATINARGRPEPASIRYVWPENRPKPSGQALVVYLTFAEAARDVLSESHYLPASLGGCPVSASVDVTFDFGVAAGVRP